MQIMQVYWGEIRKFASDDWRKRYRLMCRRIVRYCPKKIRGEDFLAVICVFSQALHMQRSGVVAFQSHPETRFFNRFPQRIRRRSAFQAVPHIQHYRDNGEFVLHIIQVRFRTLRLSQIAYIPRIQAAVFLRNPGKKRFSPGAIVLIQSSDHCIAPFTIFTLQSASIPVRAFMSSTFSSERQGNSAWNRSG